MLSDLSYFYAKISKPPPALTDVRKFLYRAKRKRWCHKAQWFGDQGSWLWTKPCKSNTLLTEFLVIIAVFCCSCTSVIFVSYCLHGCYSPGEVKKTNISRPEKILHRAWKSRFLIFLSVKILTKQYQFWFLWLHRWFESA